MKASNRDIIREINKSKSRFLSILIIVLLGTLVFVGLGTTVFDIEQNIDDVLKKEKIYDIRIESVIPFTKKDKELINQLSNIDYIDYKYENVDLKNNLHIENKNISKGSIIELKNTNSNSKYYDISYLSKNSFKNGIKLNKIFFSNQGIKDENVALIYLKKDKKMKILSKEYLNFLKQYKTDLRKIFINRPDNSKKDILIEIENAIARLNEGELEISKNISKLQKNELEIKNKREKLINAKFEFEKYKKEIEKGKLEIFKNRTELNENLQKINLGLLEIEKNIPDVLVGLAQIKENEENLEKRKNSIFLSKAKYEKYKLEIKENREKLEKVLKTRYELLENKKKIDEGLLKIKDAEKEINIKEAKLNKEIISYNNSYISNLNKLNAGEKKIKNGYIKIEKEKYKISEKKEELNLYKNNIVKPIYNISSVFDNVDFLNIYNNVDSMNIISFTFSTLFFTIALFIISTTIIRFSIEQRNIIGTYKFLGYNNYTIIKKFVVYTLIPTFIGIILGTLIGTYIIPRIIYPSFFSDFIEIFNDFNNYTDYISIFLNVIILILVIILTIILILRKILKEKVIKLLTTKNEKAPRFKIKSILLRNIIKYRLRFFMTILGIGLCTSLIYLGISLKYSILDIVDRQYNKVQRIDASIYFKHDASQNQIEEYIKNIKNEAEVLRLNVNNIKIENKNREYSIPKIEIIDDNYKNFYNFDIKSNEVVMSKNIYDLLGLDNKNNIIKYLDIYNLEYNLEVDKTFKNHISEYIYTLNNKAKPNSIVVKYNNSKKVDLESDIVYSIIYTKDMRKIFNSQIKSLNIIVLFMITLGASLAIIVTYNLGNINIIERRRELATLEVLGYTDNELDSYIFREIIILAIISIIFGMGLGRMLHRLVAYQFRSSIQLILSINSKVLIFSFILPLIFVGIVLLILKKKIKNINMIESLKISE